MAGNVLTVTDQNFSDTQKKNPKLIIDCWAPWCGPCRMIGPIVDALAGQYAGKVAFGKLNIDENQDTATKLDIMAIPTLIFYKDGKMVDRIVGAVTKQSIEKTIAEHFSK